MPDVEAESWIVEVPGNVTQPFQASYWHKNTELGWGTVVFVDGHVEFLRATPKSPDYQNGRNYTFAFDGPK